MTQEKTSQAVQSVNNGIVLKYRTSHVFPRKPGISFSQYEDEYKYNESIDNLVVVGKVDTQEVIESNMDCALYRILDKYLPEEIEKSVNKNVVFVDGVYERANQDLSDLGAEYERVEDIRQRYNMPDGLSYFEVLENLKSKQLELNEHIKKLESKTIKEVEDETKTNE